MDKQSTQIATVCECIDHSFAFAMWCEGFARHVDPDDMIAGLDRAFDVVSDATRLQSFLALRNLDEFLRKKKSKADDLIAADLGIDASAALGDVGETFLAKDERVMVNKQIAHLTEKLTLDGDSEVDLDAILKRSMPVLSRLATALRKADARKEATHWLDKTDALIKHAEELNEEANEGAAAE